MGFCGDKVLMGMAIHINEITQDNFVIALSAGEYTSKELIRGLGWRQGQSFPRAGDDLIKCIFSHNANLTTHAYVCSKIFAKSCVGALGI
jgi:hypothetical protein